MLRRSDQSKEEASAGSAARREARVPEETDASRTLQVLELDVKEENVSFDASGHLSRVEKTEAGKPMTYVDLIRDSMGYVLCEEVDGDKVFLERDNLGRTNCIRGLNGYEAKYTYDWANRVRTVTTETGTGIATYDYLGATPNPLRRINGDGTTTNHTRDSFGRLTELNSQRTNSTHVTRFQYEYDARGLLKWENRLHDGKGDVYWYDGQNRLTFFSRDSGNPANEWTTRGSTSPPVIAEYQLDGDHHRSAVKTSTDSGQSWSTESYTTAAQRHHYTAVGSFNRTFDADGRLTSFGSATSEYDATDNLVCVKFSGVPVVTYTYDALGRRRTKTSGTTTHRYVYAGPWMLQDFKSVNGGPEDTGAWHYHGVGIDDVLMSRRIDVADLDQDGNTGDLVELYHHKNQQNSITELTLPDGTVVEKYRYDAFGKPTIYDRSGNLAGAPPSENTFLFTGREYDVETGCYHYRARTYDPTTGTFLQEDPSGRIDDLNPVVYTMSNPVSFVDPTGNSSLSGALSDLWDFIAKNIDLVGGILLDGVPGLRALLDAFSALAGKDYTAWIEGGGKGSPEAMGWWARLKKGGYAAIALAGSIVGTLARIGGVFRRVRDLVRRAKGGCFVVGTLVLLASGELVPIEEVAVGDQVSTQSPAVVPTQQSKDGSHVVDAVSLRAYQGAIHIVVVRDYAGAEVEIQGTPEHPFWSAAKRRWVKLADLRVGALLRGVGGRGVVVSHRVDFRDTVVANLSVGTANTFRVGGLGVLVHNGCRIGSSEPGAFNQIVKRKAKGADGGASIHIISRDGNGNALSVTHRVTNNGKVVHQHTSFVGQETGNLVGFPTFGPPSTGH